MNGLNFNKTTRKKITIMSFAASGSMSSLKRIKTVGHYDSAPPPEKILVIMVGLPATGKSYISKKLINYFNWLGYKVCNEIYSLSAYG